jgi:hypothetical protein
MPLILRNVKGSSLTYTEMDNNLLYLQSLALGSGITGPTGPSGDNSYKVYTALLTQSGINDPKVNVLENTLSGNLIWTRSNTGSYLATLNGEFPDANKVAIFINQSGVIALGGGDTIYTYAYVNDSNSIILETLINTNYSDSQMYLSSIEIRVYP